MIICGVYVIRHEASGKVYVGSSCDVNHRWSGHRFLLRKGAHPNHKLQHAWTRYGEDAFSFEVLEECARPDLLAREQRYLDALNAVTHGYNCRARTTAPPAGAFSVDTRARLSAAARARQLGKERGPLSEATKEKISRAKKGKALSDEVKQKLSRVRKGHPVSQRSIDVLVARNKERAGTKASAETRARMSAAHLRRGPISAETRAKQSEARKAAWERRRKCEAA